MTSTPRLALIRHGRSAHVHAGWIDHAGFAAWRAAYESAGIRERESVPSETVRLLDGVSLFASSDTARAVQSAQLLARERDVTVSPLLRELELAAPRLAGIHLPLAGWAIAVGFHAARQTLNASEAERVCAASQWLTALAEEHGFVAVVTHGSFRRELSRALMRMRWRRDVLTSAWHHWSVWTFSGFVR